MKHIFVFFRRLFIFFWVMSLAIANASATELSNALFSPTKTIDEISFQRKGMGIRHMLWTEIYAVALYVPEKSPRYPQWLSDETPIHVDMHILSSFITRERLLAAIHSGFQRSARKSEIEIKAYMEALNKAIQAEVKLGDRFEYTYLPPQGTFIWRNGQLLSVIPGVAFKQALFGIWLGDDPVQPSLKETLLGH